MPIDYSVELWSRKPDSSLILAVPSQMLHSFTYSLFLRSGGSVEVRLYNIEKYINTLRLPNALDYEWRIFRRDTQYQLKQELVAVGLHRGSQYLQLEAGNWLMYSYAVAPTDLLTTKATRLDNSVKSGLIADVATEYARDLLDIFPSITVPEPAEKSSNTTTLDEPYKKLSVILELLADADGADYLIDNTYTFRWLYPNVILEPVEFDSGFIKNIRIVENYINLATSATVLGTGGGDLRIEDTQVLDAYYNKYGEFFFNEVVRTTSIDDPALLPEKANSFLNEREQEIFDVQFQLTNHPSFLYGKDVNVGDVVQLKFFDQIYKVHIYYAYVTLSKDSNETITLGGKYYYG